MVKIADKKLKIVFTEKIVCPHCNKKIVVKKTKKLITAAEKAEYEEKVIVEKDSQKTLNEVKGPGKPLKIKKKK